MATTPKTRAARAAQSTQTVKALVPVNYDHTMHAPGETEIFDVRAEDLEQLLEVKAVELVDAEEAPAA